MAEPVHDLTVRSTATSESEGRLKLGFMTRKKKNKLAKKMVKSIFYGNNNSY